LLSDNQIKSIKFKTKCYNVATGFVVACALVAPAIYASYNKDFNQPEDKLDMVQHGTQQGTQQAALAALPNTLEISEGQYNALRITKHLLKTSNMSKGELLSTLEGKGFSLDDATYALDTIKPNWGIRAQYTAIEILEVNTLPLTKEELYIQLTGEYGFTALEANEGISYIDYPAYLNMKRGIKQ
jgi:hypothetical protein